MRMKVRKITTEHIRWRNSIEQTRLRDFNINSRSLELSLVNRIPLVNIGLSVTVYILLLIFSLNLVYLWMIVLTEIGVGTVEKMSVS